MPFAVVIGKVKFKMTRRETLTEGQNKGQVSNSARLAVVLKP